METQLAESKKQVAINNRSKDELAKKDD